MQSLQTRADDLKAEQIRLKQTINEKATASILLGLFSKDSKSENSEDPKIEELLRRSVDEIPDASKLPELPALILPGQHNSKKHKASEVTATTTDNELPNDGIDYELLGKDRSKCTPAELDQIRRERNRMHAKRTRDRKRLFMEEMAEMCQVSAMETEHLDKLFEAADVRVEAQKIKSTNLDSKLLARNIDAHFMTSIGATSVCKQSCPLDEVTVSTVNETEDEYRANEYPNFYWNKFGKPSACCDHQPNDHQCNANYFSCVE